MSSSAAQSPSSSPSSSPTEAPTSSYDTSSTPTPTTSNSPTSNSPPATSAAPTSAPQSSPAEQTTSAAAQTSSPPQSASASAAASSTSSAAAASASSTISYTSQVATTLLSTDPAGSIVYITTSTPEVVVSSIPSSPSTGGSSHTGVIVGAVVGGVAGITILALLLFCIRKRVRRDEFDGNFDPDHVVGRTDGGGGTLPHVDLAEEVTPFPQSSADRGNSSMRQYGDPLYVGLPSSFTASGQTSPEIYSPGVGAPSIDTQSRQFMQPAPPVNMYGAGPVDWHTPRPGASPPPSTSSYNTTSTRGTKEREALGRIGQGQGLGLATQPEVPEGSGDVVVHQDAGRAPIEDHSQPKEIPPAYESIPQD